MAFLFLLILLVLFLLLPFFPILLSRFSWTENQIGSSISIPNNLITVLEVEDFGEGDFWKIQLVFKMTIVGCFLTSTLVDRNKLIKRHFHHPCESVHVTDHKVACIFCRFPLYPMINIGRGPQPRFLFLHDPPSGWLCCCLSPLDHSKLNRVQFMRIRTWKNVRIHLKENRKNSANLWLVSPPRVACWAVFSASSRLHSWYLLSCIQGGLLDCIQCFRYQNK